MNYNFPLITTMLLTSLVAGPVQAEANFSLLEPGEKGFRASTDPIKINIAQSLPSHIYPYLRLELDAYDVSDVSQRERNQLIYVPTQPLEPGQHELRVIAELPDGSIEELALWAIEVRDSRAFRQARIGGQLDLEVMHRVDDNFTDNTVERTQGQGSIAMHSQHADGDWKVSSNANMTYHSNEEQTQVDDEMVLHDYLIKTNWPQTQVALGHQGFEVESLVLNECSRRGISASYQTEQQRMQFTAFGVRTEEITGFNNFTGVNDSDQLSSGMLLTAYPLVEKPERLIFTAVYLNSKGNVEGEAETNEAIEDTEGKAQAVIVDSYQLNRTLRLRGEYAISQYDFDGVNTGYEAEEDSATSLMLNYDTTRDEQRLSEHSWNIGVLQQRVGPWFYSSGYSALQADRLTTRISGYYQGPTLGMNAVVSLGNDNVDDNSNLPKIEYDTLSLNLNYTPQVDSENDNDNDTLNLFSNPSFAVSWTDNTQLQVATPSGYLDTKIDTRFNELGLSATFSGETWYWSVSYTDIREEDHTNLYTSVSDVAAFEASLSINEYFSIDPNYQYIKTREVEYATQTKTEAGGIMLNLNYPENLSNMLSYTVSRDTSTTGDSSRTAITEFSSQWQYLEVKNNKPGVSFFIRASHENSNNLTTHEEQHQAYVGINVSWPANL